MHIEVDLQQRVKVQVFNMFSNQTTIEAPCWLNTPDAGKSAVDQAGFVENLQDAGPHA